MVLQLINLEFIRQKLNINIFCKEMENNLLYLAKPVYGGWVTFTAHLSHKLNASIYKIAGRNETFDRDFGYECKYRNKSIGEIIQLKNIIITAVDKNYWEYLYLFPSDTKIVIHDPTECKLSKNKNPRKLLLYLNARHLSILKELNKEIFFSKTASEISSPTD